MANGNVDIQEENSLWAEWLAAEEDYLNGHPAEGEEWEALMEWRPPLYDYALPEVLTMGVLDFLAKVLYAAGESDPEVAHSLESKVMAMFITGLSEGAYTPEHTRAMAVKLKAIGQIPFARWFA